MPASSFPWPGQPHHKKAIVAVGAVVFGVAAVALRYQVEKFVEPSLLVLAILLGVSLLYLRATKVDELEKDSGAETKVASTPPTKARTVLGRARAISSLRVLYGTQTGTAGRLARILQVFPHQIDIVYIVKPVLVITTKRCFQ